MNDDSHAPDSDIDRDELSEVDGLDHMFPQWETILAALRPTRRADVCAGLALGAQIVRELAPLCDGDTARLLSLALEDAAYVLDPVNDPPVAATKGHA